MPRREPTPPSATKLLAAAIRRRRRALALTQIDLSRFAGCGPDFVYDVEAGKPTLRLDKLLSVLSVLGLELRLTEGRQTLSVAESLQADGDSAS